MRLALPNQPSNAQYELRGIPDGVAGVRTTLDIMVALARRYQNEPLVRYQAEAIVANIPSKAAYQEAAAIQAWVRDTIRYTSDSVGAETLKTPDVTLQTMQGDCDDKALLAAALLGSIGFHTRFVAVATSTPGDYNHVYAEVRIGDAWHGVETTEPVPFGWVPPRVDYPIIRNV